MSLEQLDLNYLVFAVQFTYDKNLREVGCALFNQDSRLLQIYEFQDNEHFSAFESILLQVYPASKDVKFTLIVLFPELKTETAKIKDIFAQCDFEIIEKQKKSFSLPNQNDLDFLLEKPFKQYIQESALVKGLQSLQAIIEFLSLTKDQTNQKIFQLETLKANQFMKLDLAARNALMISPKIGSQFTSTTLVDYLDKCKSAIGQRCLRRWVKMPLQDIQQINQRLDIVEFLVQNTSFRNYTQEDFLKKIPDLDKLYSKFYRVKSNKKHNANLNDCLKVYQLVCQMKKFVTYMDAVKNKSHILETVFLNPFKSVLGEFSKFQSMIEQSIDLDKANQGEFIVNPKFSSVLLELDRELNKIRSQIEDIRNSEEKKLNISISLVESGTHTYVFEANKKQADEAFRSAGGKKYKTLTVKNRQLTFTLEALQSAVVEFVHIKEEYEKEQQTVIEKILQIVAGYYPALEIASQLISETDVYASFAQVIQSAPREFAKPILTKTKNLILRDSRHPLLETIDQNCIMNDLEMTQEDSRVHIITGPNMGGKSTYIRQVAICVFMAHIGCFVPCRYAEIPIIDAIITRVGASDMQMRGISTFMSEMLEASCMLKTATPSSLIIIDELGRGTSTSEGFGIAWAIAEHIALQLNSFCLFATHFHEMTLMEKEIPGVQNYFVSCMINDNKITMQYKVKKGSADRSYGLLVAEMLNFPKEVLEDARKKAEELERFNIDTSDIKNSEMEVEQFESIEDEIIYYSKKSSLSQKEQVNLLIQDYKKSLKQSQKGQKLPLTMKEKVLKILKN